MEIREMTSWPAPALIRTRSIRLIRAAPRLWRVVDDVGRILGHLEAERSERGVRYRARRFHAATRALRELGNFWSADDAIDALRCV